MAVVGFGPELTVFRYDEAGKFAHFFSFLSFLSVVLFVLLIHDVVFRIAVVQMLATVAPAEHLQRELRPERGASHPPQLCKMPRSCRS